MVVEGTRVMNTAVAAMDEAVAAMRLSRVGERESESSYPLSLSCFDFFVDLQSKCWVWICSLSDYPSPCWLDSSQSLIGEFDTWKIKAF